MMQDNAADDLPVGPDVRLPEPSEVVGGKYVITRRIGEGGMGVIFEAEHARVHQRVALKFLHPANSRSSEACTRFAREARAMGQLRSEHAVHVLEVAVTPDGIPYTVMDLLEGRDLEEERELRGKAFPITEAVDYVAQACAAMAEAHGIGIVHRDLKPSNLFLCPNPDGTITVKVLDFGISKWIVDSARVTSTFISMGTPLYMSPEQVRSAKYVDDRADIWSLGVILYELLAGEPPFSGTPTAVIASVVADDVPPLRARRPEVSEDLEAVILRALTKDPEDRFADVRAMAQALAPFTSRPIELPPLREGADAAHAVAPCLRAPTSIFTDLFGRRSWTTAPWTQQSPIFTNGWWRKKGVAATCAVLLAVPIAGLSAWPSATDARAQAAQTADPGDANGAAGDPKLGACGRSVRTVRATGRDAAPAGAIRVPAAAEGPANDPSPAPAAPRTRDNPLYL